MRWALAGLWLVLALCGCGGASDDPPLNVLLILVDTLRADHLETYGYERATSPALEAFARESVVFTRAYSHAPWTKPSVATLMTSLEPRDHGVSQWDHRLPREHLTLALYLSSRGYRTEAYVSHHALHPSFSRFHLGFDVYDVSAFEQRGSPHDISSAAPVSDTAIAALDGITAPFFLWLHYFDPHESYLPHAAHAFGEADVDLYDGEIAHTDRQIARVLEALRTAGRLDDTIVAITADHGEEFLDHGGRFHGQTLFDEVLRVPLVIHAPGLSPARIERTVGLVDLAPTLLELAGVPVPDGFAGRSIPREGQRLLLREDRPVFAETHHHAESRALIVGRWKLIHDRRRPKGRMLFDLVADPRESVNLFAREPRTAGRLDTVLADHARQPGGAAEWAPRTEEFHELLEQLGYTR